MTISTSGSRRGMTCQVTAFEVLNAPAEPEAPPRKWMAVATAHVYDPDVVVPPLTRTEAVLTGETMRVISSRSYADTESRAMMLALNALLFQLAENGFTANDPDIRIW